MANGIISPDDVKNLVIGFAGDFTGGFLSSLLLASKITQRFQPDEQKTALQEALQEALTEACKLFPEAQRSVTKYYLEQLSRFLQAQIVNAEMAKLLNPQPATVLEKKLLTEVFTDIIDGYTPDQIPDLDFDLFIETLVYSFYTAVKSKEALRKIIHIERLDQLVKQNLTTIDLLEKLLYATRQENQTISDLIQVAWQQAQDLEAIKRLLQEQRQGLTLFPQYKTAIENFLIAYLGSDDEPVPFGGRDQQLAQLEAWRTHSPKQRLLLAAPAGSGKSALLVRWSQSLLSKKDVAVVFMPISIRFGTNREEVTFACLAMRLAHLYGKEIPNAYFRPHEWRGLVAEYLHDPLPDGRQLLLILDGLDEAIWTIGEDLFPLKLPNSVRLVVSARYLAGEAAEVGPWLQRLGWDRFTHLAETLTLERLTRAGVKDVLQQMGYPFDKIGLQTDIVSELHYLSEGDPLLVELYVKELRSKGSTAISLTPGKLREFEPGYKGFFGKWWADQEKIWEDDGLSLKHETHTLLDLLATALGPLATVDIEGIAADGSLSSSRYILDAMKPLKRFVLGDGKGQGIVFAHPRLAHYFWDQMNAREQERLENRFIDYCQQITANLASYGLNPEGVSSYVLLYYGAHLERAKKTQGRLKKLRKLSTPVWLQLWEESSSSFDGFLMDLERLWQAAVAAERLDLETRCALITSTIPSLVNRVDSELYKNMLIYASDLLSPFVILARVRHLPQVTQRADALYDLAAASDHLSHDVFAYALELAVEIAHENERGLLGLAPHLPPELMVKALQKIGHLSEYKQATMIGLMGEGRVWPEAVVAQALLTAEKMKEPTARSATLSALVPHTRGAQQKRIIDEAVKEVQKPAWSPWRARSFRHLARYMPDDAIRRLWLVWLTQSSSDRYGDRKDETYEWLAREYISRGWLNEAVELLQSLTSDGSLHKAIVSLAPMLPHERVAELLEVVPKSERTGFLLPKALGVLAKYAAADLQEHILARARSMDQRPLVLVALSLIAPHIENSQKEATLWQEVKDTWLMELEKEGWNRWLISAILEIIELLPDKLVTEIASYGGLPEEIVAAFLNKFPPHIREKQCHFLFEEALNGRLGSAVIAQLIPYLSPAKREKLFSIMLSRSKEVGDQESIDHALMPYQALTLGSWPDLKSNSDYYTKYDNLRVLLLMASCPEADELPALAWKALQNTLQKGHPLHHFLKSYSRYVIPVLPNFNEKERHMLISKILVFLDGDAPDSQPLPLSPPPLDNDVQAYHYRLLLMYLSGNAVSFAHQHLLAEPKDDEIRGERLFLLCKLFDLLPPFLQQHLRDELRQWEQIDSEIQEITIPYPTQALGFAVLAAEAPIDERDKYIERIWAEIERSSAPNGWGGSHDKTARLCAQIATVLATADIPQAELFFEQALARRRSAEENIKDKSTLGYRDRLLLPWLPPERQIAILIESIRALSSLDHYSDYKIRPDILIDLVSFWIRLPQSMIREIWRETLPVLAKSERKFFLGDLHALAPVILALGGPKTVHIVADEIKVTIEQWP